jgi:MFS family permease
VQLRTNSWMLMTGSIGMVASTLPVQWLLPQVGWRPLFWGLAVLMALSMLVLAWRVPDWDRDLARARPAGSYARSGATPTSARWRRSASSTTAA